MRVVIAGSPRAGKTTRALEVARRLDLQTLHTDDMIGRGFTRDEEAREVARWLDTPGGWVIEGVTAARGLRAWLERNPSGKPCDQVVLLRTPHVPLTRGQQTMAKGCDTVWNEIAPRLAARGVTVVTRG